MKHNLPILLCLALSGQMAGQLHATEREKPVRPNIVWLMAEDVAPQFMALYNQGRGARTPNLEQMAKEGLIFQNAYCNAPVSSVARSTLITGCYAPRLGASWHRKLEEVPMPDGLHMFPTYLRRVGYHTSNASKTDYNCQLDPEAWSKINGRMGEWRNRGDKNQPFFFVRTNATSHESSLQFDEKRVGERPTFHPPTEVNLLPHHPDTELFRYTYATFYDRIAGVDNELGTLLDMLRADGELDNTFIFYFGDNGGSLPGSKGYTGESGLRVPLVVYIPAQWRNRIPISIGSRVQGLVSFMDFAPTLLHLAGVEIPKQMDGTPFLGEDITEKELNKRNVVYGYGDRFDELYAFNRTVRKGKLKYSRNFAPHQPKSLYATYRYKQPAFRQWKQLFEAGKLTECQQRFFLPQGPEELYDLEADPHETQNLALLPAHSGQLKQMRRLLDNHLLTQNDLGLLTESIWMAEGRQNPTAYGRQSHQRLEQLLRVANLQRHPFAQGGKEAAEALASSDPALRYWALTACVWWGQDAAKLANQVEPLLNDTCALVQSRAALFLALIGHSNPVEAMKHALRKAGSAAESLSILNDMAYLKEQNQKLRFALTPADVPQSGEGCNWRIEYLK